MKNLTSYINEKLKLKNVRKPKSDLDSLKDATKAMLKDSEHFDKNRLNRYLNGNLSIKLTYAANNILDKYSDLLTDQMQFELEVYLKGDSTNEEISTYYDTVYQAMEEYFKEKQYI